SLKEQVINEVVSGQFFLRAARIDPATNRLRDVTIYDLGDPERRRIISADSGRMAYTPGGRDLYLTLLDGDIREVNRSDPTQFDRTLYVVNKIRVQSVGNTLQRTENDTYRSDREMGICEMRGVVAAARQEAEQARRSGRSSGSAPRASAPRATKWRSTRSTRSPPRASCSPWSVFPWRCGFRGAASGSCWPRASSCTRCTTSA